ncbi:hypothetical protein RB195_022760 [Necator americanus]|uniref:Endonuclease/exonuclease/phosphatase domain-containing protein n=1 Tax=Necator americanus TaxID=51031 RepID=A0ABR1EH51_NECAM
MAAANLLILRYFTLITTWLQLALKPKEEFDEWLTDGTIITTWWSLAQRRRDAPLYDCGIAEDSNSGSMRGNVDEFEDALEYSEGFAENTIYEMQNSTSYNRNRLQSVYASGCFVATSQADSERSFLPSYVSIPTEFSASRRDRLNALRCRMREEFGAKDATFSSPTTVDWDSLSIASEGTSLHSWHRRVLAETQTIIVHPSDSMSTKAGLPFPSSLLFSDTRKTAGHHETDSSTWATMHPTSTVHTTLLSTISSAGPPPNHPPPPLPPVESERYMNTDFRSPPPLPPRNRAVRLLGSVVAGSLSNSSEDKNRKESPDSGGKPGTVAPGRTGLQESCRLPKRKRTRMAICTYNARTLASEAAIEDLMMQAKKIKYDVIGLTETRRRHPLNAVYETGEELF